MFDASSGIDIPSPLARPGLDISLQPELTVVGGDGGTFAILPIGSPFADAVLWLPTDCGLKCDEDGVPCEKPCEFGVATPKFSVFQSGLA